MLEIDPEPLVCKAGIQPIELFGPKASFSYLYIVEMVSSTEFRVTEAGVIDNTPIRSLLACN